MRQKKQSSPLLGCFAAFIVGLGISLNVTAQNLGTTLSDLWWNPAESGWGVTVDHQQNFMFLTFFIYQANGTPYWVTAQLQKVGTGGLATFPQIFTGPVYQTNGPWFGGAFNPAAVTTQTVGTATFTIASSYLFATLQYSINGVNVTKSLQRQTLVNVNYSGTYLGGTAYTLSGCSNPANNGMNVADSGVLTITQAGTSVHIVAQGSAATCTFNGTYSQSGSLGQTGGNFSCSDGTFGSFTLIAMQWTLFGMTAGLSGQSQFCAFNGVLGGITGTHVAP